MLPGNQRALKPDKSRRVSKSETLRYLLYNVTGNFEITVAAEAAKYGLPWLGYALGSTTLEAAGAGVGIVSGVTTAVATTMDARARYECGEPIVP